MIRAAALTFALLLAGCNESMDEQNRFHTFGTAGTQQAWPGESEALQPPEGTVAQGALAEDAAQAAPPPITLALVERGRERYEIYCSVCHGLAGEGDGIVVARGFPKPAAFTDAAPMHDSAAHMIDVIGRGQGRMYGFADRIAPRDRWAIVAYIRALQSAGSRRPTR